MTDQVEVEVEVVANINAMKDREEEMAKLRDAAKNLGVDKSRRRGFTGNRCVRPP